MMMRTNRFLTDTHPEVEKVRIARIRRMSAAEKFRRIGELNQLLENLALAEIRRRHPEADAWECRMRLASRRIPSDLLHKAFGWSVNERGY
jgi:hypothetical protein